MTTEGTRWHLKIAEHGSDSELLRPDGSPFHETIRVTIVVDAADVTLVKIEHLLVDPEAPKELPVPLRLMMDRTSGSPMTGSFFLPLEMIDLEVIRTQETSDA